MSPAARKATDLALHRRDDLRSCLRLAARPDQGLKPPVPASRSAGGRKGGGRSMTPSPQPVQITTAGITIADRGKSFSARRRRMP